MSKFSSPDTPWLRRQLESGQLNDKSGQTRLSDCMKLSEFTCIISSLPLSVELAFALFPHPKAFGCLTQKSGHDDCQNVL